MLCLAILAYAIITTVVAAPVDPSFDLIGYKCGTEAPKIHKSLSLDDGCLDSFTGRPSQSNPTNGLSFDSSVAGINCGSSKAEARFGRYFAKQNIHYIMDARNEFKIIIGPDFADSSTACVFVYEMQ
ncbi:UNVERIFIED_CONTAM: hypothetical protein HDU68_003671 [Siphonaria sp. JEL0065]|nr:hypothetical protein HDU68_003671 [Siphonaria sp. JEL0065]